MVAVASSCSSRTQTEQPVGELVGLLARGAAAHDLLGEAAQVLHQQDPEADRECPQLADRQRLHLLVRAHGPPQAVRIEAAVGMRDVGPGETEDPGVAGQVPLGQFRELAVVVRRQVVVDLAKLLVDDVVVVDEPLRGRGDRALVLDRGGQEPVALQQDPAVVRDPGLKRTSSTRRAGDSLRSRQRLGVLLQPLHAEQLRTNRLVRVGSRANQPANAARAGLRRAWGDLIVDFQRMA